MYVSFYDTGYFYDYVVYGFVAPGGYTNSFYDPLASNLEITFDGHGVPFSTVHGLTMYGDFIYWRGTTRGDENGGLKTETFWSRSEAQDFVDDMSPRFTDNIVMGYASGHVGGPTVCPPSQLTFSMSYTYHAGYVEQDPVTEDWVGHAAYNEFTGAAYCVRWIFTNRGVLIESDGLHDTYSIAGFETSISGFTNPPASGNIWGYIKQHCASSLEDEPQDVENPVCCPYHGGTLVANIRTDMGGCQDAEWWDAVMGEYDGQEAAD